MNLFSALYYRLCQLMISVGNKDNPEIAALFLLGITLFLNFYSIISISNILEYRFNLALADGFLIALCYLSLVAILYFTMATKKNLIKIVARDANESKQSKLRGKLIAVLYLAVSYLLMFFLMYLMMLKNRGEL